MQTQAIDEQKCIAQTDSRHLIGKDTEGRAHCYDPCRGVIWVADGWLDADAIEVAYRTRDCGAWREYVAARCAWAWHNIGSDPVPELAASALAKTTQ